MTQPPLDALENRPVPEVAGAFRESKERILARWRDEVSRLLPSADQLTRRQIENDLPQVLDRAIAALEAATPGATGRLIAVSPVHGEARYHQSFNLDELLAEYSILRRILLEEISRRLPRPLNVIEIIEINDAIDVAMRQATIAYVEYQANELRSSANAMTKYLAFLSHDLRGGLHAIMMLVEVLRKQIGTEERFAESVADLDAMRRMLLDTVGAMERFLDAEKLRRGKMPVSAAPLKLVELVREVVRSMTHSAAQNRVTLDAQISPTLVVHTDRAVLLLIVQNLISNAIKYAQKSPVIVRSDGPEDDGSCTLSVIDQGPGIAPEKIDLLFSPFVRGESYGQKGAGLGLWIARQAADLLGARLWVESTPGQGAAFHVKLPKLPPTQEPNLL